MKTFAIDSDNKVTVFATGTDARNLADATRFTTKDDLASLAANWPSSRLVAIWNGIPGLPLVNKFTDRKTAIHRIWSAIQQLEPAPAAPAAPLTPASSAAARKSDVPSTRGSSKKDAILNLLKRNEGATLEDLMTATGWQAHSVRGFISGTLTKKLNLKVDSVKRDGHRVYSVAG